MHHKNAPSPPARQYHQKSAAHLAAEFFLRHRFARLWKNSADMAELIVMQVFYDKYFRLRRPADSARWMASGQAPGSMYRYAAIFFFYTFDGIEG